MNETIDTISSSLSKLYGLPGYTLITVFCLVAGYILKSWSRFPNDAIPLAVVLIGMILNSMIADPASDDLLFRIWLVKNVVFGGICGFISWIFHNQVIKRLESKAKPEPLSPPDLSSP